MTIDQIATGGNPTERTNNMSLYNFYIDCQIDGRETRLKGGPRSKDGGFHLTIYQRDEGVKIKALTVEGFANNGELVLDCYGPKHGHRFTIKNKR